MPETKNLIEIKHISKKFGDLTVLKDISLKVKEKEVVVIIGPSGSGKSTLLRCINGLETPTSGAIFFDGLEVNGEKNINYVRTEVGMVFQRFNLFPHMTVEQNISYVPNLINKKNKEKTKLAVSKWMKLVGLDEELKERYPAELSGGQQQRVGIARALAASPEILLMDEPFGAVDEITRGQLQIELKQIHKKTGITVLFVTHDISEALKLGTKVLVMDKGQVQQYAKPDDLLRNPNTDFVKQLVDKERRTCYLPDERLEDCEYSGAGNK